MIFIIQIGEWKDEEVKCIIEWDWEDMGTASDSTYSINDTAQWSLISGHSPWEEVRPEREDPHEWIGEKKEKKIGRDPSRMWALRTSPYGVGP